MFGDILGTIVGFISIILLLSILVTALVQTVQVALRLRSRNLMKGVAALIAKAREEAHEKGGETKSGSGSEASESAPTGLEALLRLLEPRDKNKRHAMALLNAPNVALIEGVKNPTSPLRYWIFGPRVSWLDPAEVPKAVEQCKEVDDLDGEAFAADFSKIDKPLARRFKLITRWWTFILSLVIAFGFQVSTPDLVADLQEDSDRRERIEANVDELLAHSTEALATISDDTVAPEALERLERRYPAYEPQIEEASGVGVNRAFLLEELRLALEDVPEREEVVAAYDELLDSVLKEREEKVGETIESTLDLLREYDVALWSEGWAFYWDRKEGLQGLHWDHILGILITTILLSLGAPFWFDRLRDVINLRDALAAATGRPAGSKPAETSSSAGAGGAEVEVEAEVEAGKPDGEPAADN